MEYSEGYLVFIDILGFSNYVKTLDSCESTARLFDFVNKFSYLFNSGPKLNIEVSFFSDTIIITSREFESLLLPIYIAESYLKKNLGRYFRGSIVHGKYYHKDGMTFGPAVVSGYELENRAAYSRILVDKTVDLTKEKSIFFFTDIDGLVCLNPYGILFTEIIASAPDGLVYPDNITEALIHKLSEHRVEILSLILQNKGTPVVDKYLWRIRPYNYTCNLILNMPIGELIYEDVGYSIGEELKTSISNLTISMDDIFDYYGDTYDQL